MHCKHAAQRQPEPGCASALSTGCRSAELLDVYRAAVLAAQQSLRRTAVPSLTALRCFLAEFLVRPATLKLAVKRYCKLGGSTADPRRLLCLQAAASCLIPELCMWCGRARTRSSCPHGEQAPASQRPTGMSFAQARAPLKSA